MKKIKYIVRLSEEEQVQLEAIVHKGKCAARKQTRARILLKAAAAIPTKDIMQALDVSEEMVYRVRQRFVEEGMHAALQDKPRPGKKRKLDDRQCADLIEIARGDAPEGHGRWTLRLLADKVVSLGFADSFSHETVRQVLKKFSLRPTQRHSNVLRK
jgi:transposase